MNGLSLRDIDAKRAEDVALFGVRGKGINKRRLSVRVACWFCVVRTCIFDDAGVPQGRTRAVAEWAADSLLEVA